MYNFFCARYSLGLFWKLSGAVTELHIKLYIVVAAPILTIALVRHSQSGKAKLYAFWYTGPTRSAHKDQTALVLIQGRSRSLLIHTFDLMHFRSASVKLNARRHEHP